MNPVFDFEPYRFTLDGTTMAMDELHIQMLRAAVDLCPPGCTVVEIGSYRGASTSALIDALNAGRIGTLHIVEINPTATLANVLAMAGERWRIHLHTQPFWELEVGTPFDTIDCPDLVFIDGAHDWPAYADTLKALTSGADIICMHDSNSYPAYEGTWGATSAARMLMQMEGRCHYHDYETREGMRTDRGFLVSSGKPRVFHNLQDIAG